MPSRKRNLPTRFAPSLLALALGTAWADEPVTLDAVTVRAERGDSYRADSASIASFGDAPLLDTPASVSVISRQLLDDRQSRLLSDVLKNDASAGDSYAPVGYYENFAVRGFTLNAASSYRINGRTAVGEQNIALDNKQQVELLKGVSGLQGGVAEPGGLVNYVTKRVENVRSVTVGTNQDGERSVAADIGGWFGSEQRVGLRVNAAHDDLRTYVRQADGTRDFLSAAVDWNISSDAKLQLDAEYQRRKQRSVPGYQLLGGTTVPAHVDPKTLLGYQSWSQPVGIESLNLGARFEYRLDSDWKAAVDSSRSRATIDDYSAFPWGCYGSATCADVAVANYFGANGDYDVSDYRSPGDKRVHDELQATLSGRFATGALRHELTTGAGGLRRTIDRRKSVNEYVGTANIYQPISDFAPTDVAIKPRHRRLDSRQVSVFANDRITIDPQWQVVAGGRLVRLDEEAFGSSGARNRTTKQTEFLPNAALIFKPAADTSLYASYAKGLSLGTEAPWFTNNADEVLAPTTARQLELGAKRDWNGVSLGAAVFQIRRAYQYARADGDGSFTYVQQGHQVNTGLELSASGRATRDLQLAASAAFIRARVEDTGTPAYEGHQAVNVPKVRATVSADWRVPGIEGLSLLGGLQYSGKKNANFAGTVSVGDYVLANLGARYATRVTGYPTVLRLTVDNVFDRRYWRDVGQSYGDGYLFPGAPRTARLAATVNF